MYTIYVDDCVVTPVSTVSLTCATLLSVFFEDAEHAFHLRTPGFAIVRSVSFYFSLWSVILIPLIGCCNVLQTGITKLDDANHAGTAKSQVSVKKQLKVETSSFWKTPLIVQCGKRYLRVF